MSSVLGCLLSRHFPNEKSSIRGSVRFLKKKRGFNVRFDMKCVRIIGGLGNEIREREYHSKRSSIDIDSFKIVMT